MKGGKKSMADYIEIPYFGTSVPSISECQSNGVLARGLSNGGLHLITYKQKERVWGYNVLLSRYQHACIISDSDIFGFREYGFINGSSEIDDSLLFSEYDDDLGYYNIYTINNKDYYSYYIPQESTFDSVTQLYTDVISAVEHYVGHSDVTTLPITYRDTNCVHNGPDSASPGDVVSVGYTFADGYGIANSSDIYVTNNGVLVPSQYSNGILTVTMPEQS